MPIPIVISIDVEPLHRLVRGVSADWEGFVELLDLMTERRAMLEDATGRPARFGWHLRMDPQIEITYGNPGWVFDRYGAEIERIRAAGDDLGLHVHTWRPTRRFFRDTWLAEFKDEAWITHCLTLALETFRAHVGSAPIGMSFGDNFMHDCALPIMQDHGLRADMSMYPGMNPGKTTAKGELCNGRPPDFRVTPRHPFKPSTADFRIPGPSNYSFWEIPVSSGIVGRNKDGSERWTKLLLGANPDWVTTIIEQTLEQPSPYILAECRTDVLMDPTNRDRFIWAIDHLEKLARERDMEFTSLEAFCDRLDAGEHLPVP